ncbi:hypothetical protein R3P38DRAFT_3334620 [Favolaschia claudopus]|uniref:Uncharacterized protein n=1 Tax=Favolaschia claudopus TaxID=2862362 RepID=A0AAV9ZDK1_9AGAR
MRVHCNMGQPRLPDQGPPNTELTVHGTFSSTGWQGSNPPDIAIWEMLRLFHEQPRARSLYPHLAQFQPVPYVKYSGEDMKKEQATIFADRNGQVFMFRSFRARWLMDASHEVEEAINVLVGDDLENNDALRVKCQDGVRGPHWPIIIGHHRQSATKPMLAAWHSANQDRVDAFMKLKIVQRIINWVERVVEIVFPGVAARFRADAAWHYRRYGIKPLFGLFWNFCLNAWFRGQRRIHCNPHTDKKNQIGVCVLVIYVLDGFVFDDDLYTWIVIWEAGVVVQLPPWTLAMYPSCLFYHFNVDVDEIEFVSTKGNVRPTRENSTPLGRGGQDGRRSMVFFNQSTMRTGPATDYDTLAEAKANGHSGTIDITLTCQEAFERYVEFRPILPEYF